MRVFVNGTFDVLHNGHLDLLEYAKSLGNYLMVALDTDDRIQMLKGKDRPVVSEDIRKRILQNLKMVDEVKLFSTNNELTKIIKSYNPDIMVVGSDWKGKTIVGSEYVKSIKFFERINNESTTKTLENYVNRRFMP